MRRHFAALLFILVIVSPAAGQIPQAEYSARRDSVAKRVGDGFVVLFGQRSPVDDLVGFRQLPEFSYLTNFHEVDAAFLMTVRSGRVLDATLFVPAREPRSQLYEGFLPDSLTVARTTGMPLRALGEFDRAVATRIGEGLALFTSPDVATRDAIGKDTLTRGQVYVQRLRAAHPSLVVRDVHEPLDSLRVRKSAAEVALMRKAIDITMKGFVAAFRAIKPGVNEGDVEAIAEYTWRLHGADGPSYNGIVGSERNSTSYHYSANNRVMRAGEVVVMDIGAMYQGYAADVTRTAPVSGKWTPDQRAIYQIVRDAQKAAEGLLGPGVRMAAGDSIVRVVEAAGLARLGLIESADATFDAPWSCASPLRCRQVFLFMAHGLGHGIGLEVHDPGGSYSSDVGLRVGETFTIEPGLYISTQLLDMLPDTPKNRAFVAKVRPVVERYHNIGIRIEDDFLVTANGLEWLSRGPREADEIEKAMRVQRR